MPSSTSSLKPLFKWTGGKRREIKHFESFFPTFIQNREQYSYVEPFVGAGAVYWHLNNQTGQNTINDFDPQLINFYQHFMYGERAFIDRLDAIGQITEHDELERMYYEQRNQDKNDGLIHISGANQAIRFFVVNQLAFSGMRRFNSSGEFNVPFGHYKGINTNIMHSRAHRQLLKQTKLFCGDFESVMQDNDNQNTFVFLDPPYTRVFKEYSATNSFGEADHRRLAKTIGQMKKASVMLIIDRSSFTEELYQDQIAATYDLKYGVNIKNRFNTSVQHLIITNYDHRGASNRY